MKGKARFDKDNLWVNLLMIGFLLAGVTLIVLGAVFRITSLCWLGGLLFLPLPVFYFGLCIYSLTPTYKKQMVRREAKKKEAAEAERQRLRVVFHPIMEKLSTAFESPLPEINVPPYILTQMRRIIPSTTMDRDLVRQVIEMVLRNAGISFGSLMVTVNFNFTPSEHAGVYESSQDFEMITINLSMRMTSEQIIAVILHETAHKILYAKGITMEDPLMNERMTDAATFLLGWPGYTAKGFVNNTHITNMGTSTRYERYKVGYLSAEEATFIYEELPAYLLAKKEEKEKRLHDEVETALRLVEPLRFLWKKIDDTLRESPLKGVTIDERDLIGRFVSDYRSGALTSKLNALEQGLSSSASSSGKANKAKMLVALKDEADGIWEIVRSHQG